MLNGRVVVESSTRVEAKAIFVLDLAAAAGVGKACAIYSHYSCNGYHGGWGGSGGQDLLGVGGEALRQ